MSINKITYLDDLIPNNLFISTNTLKIRLFFSDTLELIQNLKSLDQGQAYVVTFNFVYSWLQYTEDSPTITLSKAILITKNSNAKLIKNFIYERIHLAIDSYYLDESILEISDKSNSPGVIMSYSKINLF